MGVAEEGGPKAAILDKPKYTFFVVELQILFSRIRINSNALIIWKGKM